MANGTEGQHGIWPIDGTSYLAEIVDAVEGTEVRALLVRYLIEAGGIKKE